MSVQLDHTIVSARDNEASATFLAEILGLPAPTHDGPFVAVQVANGVALDFMTVTDAITPQHYAFAITEAEFDEIFNRIRQQSLPYWADPYRSRPGEIRERDGARGVYFEDPNGHLLEILTRGDRD